MALKRFISFSGGVESTTMCLLYGNGAKAIWADTGAEHRLMYERIALVESKIKEIHPDFEIIKVKGEAKHKGEYYDNLEDLAVAYKFMPSATARYCTRYYKIEPIDLYLKNIGECELMIGLNADEENSREGNWGLNENVHYLYPLADDGHTRDDCEEILIQHNLHPNMPVFMLRGGCKFCPFKSKKEYKAMYFLSNEEFMGVLNFEERIQDKRHKFYSIMGNGQSMRQLMAECENEKLFMPEQNWNELYKSLKKETSCGAFCHR
jgi:3'-phosphoadenosine 5'-phosphosulfate sulfotransferase (PAPS reductase)/FAD synthetase